MLANERIADSLLRQLLDNKRTVCSVLANENTPLFTFDQLRDSLLNASE